MFESDLVRNLEDRLGLEPASVRVLTLSNINISETNGPIAIKFLSEASFEWGKSCLKF